MALRSKEGVCLLSQVAVHSGMQLTAVYVPAEEGGYTAFIEEIPGAISEGETLEETRENLADALRMVLECNREIARRNEPPRSHREPLELATL